MVAPAMMPTRAIRSKRSSRCGLARRSVRGGAGSGAGVVLDGMVICNDSRADQNNRAGGHTPIARGAGASDWRIITRHLLPGFTSHLIVSITFSIPGMILSETALSFIGLGMMPPAVSWGVLLQDAQNLSAVARQNWLMIPALWVIATVLLFNFVGDGLRDAADPYNR